MSDRTASSDQGSHHTPDFFEEKEAAGKNGLGSFNGPKTDQQAKDDQGGCSKGDDC